MPDTEDLQTKRLAASLAEPAAIEAAPPTPAARAQITARNDGQIRALMGDAGPAVAAAPDGDAEGSWWDAPAPRVGAAPPPGAAEAADDVAVPAPPVPGARPAGPRHRRGGVFTAPEHGAVRGHRRAAGPILEAQGDLAGHRRAAPLMGDGSRGEYARVVSEHAVEADIARDRARRMQRGGVAREPATYANAFSGHGGGERVTPTVAPALTGATKDVDDMRRVALQQRQGVQAELAELGDGRAPRYRGTDDEAGDARAIVEDPRFARTYDLDRATDRGGAVGRKIAGVTEGLSEWWASKDRGAQLGKGAARTAVRAVPFVGAGLALGGAVKEHTRAGVDDAVAADDSQDPLTRAAAMGLAGGHRKARNKEAVAGTVGLAKDVVSVATGGLGALIPSLPGADGAADAVGGSIVDRVVDKGQASLAKAMTPERLATSAGWAAGKKTGIGVNKGLDWWDEARSPHELRPGAVAPTGGGRRDLVEAGTDQANARLLQLAATDPTLGAKLLTHLNADLPSLEDTAAPDQALRDRAQRPGGAAASPMPQPVLDAARGADRRDNTKAEHNLKPSQVARLVAGDGARGRQKARMGDTLDTLTDNETSRSWWEKSAGADVRGPAKKADTDEDEG